MLTGFINYRTTSDNLFYKFIQIKGTLTHTFARVYCGITYVGKAGVAG